METAYQTNRAPQEGRSEPVNRDQLITPFLWFDGKAEEAMKFYIDVFKNSRIVSTMPGPDGSIMSGTFELNGQEFIAFNAGPMFTFTPAISFFVTCDSKDEIDQLWAKLSADGSVFMALDEYPFSKRYGWLGDKFGISWQLMLSDSSQQISPSLLFVGKQHGKAEEAMKFYTSILPNSHIVQIERYDEKDKDPTGTVKYASFYLNGQNFIAMDSSLDHQFTFSAAISFFIKCRTQEQIDEYWEKLSLGGEEQRCGWVQDRYGVSWQIVPPVLGEMLDDPDRKRANRVMDAMLKMDKIIIKDLERAFSGDSSDDQSHPGEDLLITRTFNLPVRTVWQAWTDPETLKKWSGPKDYTCPDAFIDLRVGGKYLSSMLSPEGHKFWSTGEYKEIVPNKKLSMTDSFSDEHGNIVAAADLNMPGDWPLDLTITVNFEESDGKTVMNLRHEGLPAEILEDCKTGWQQSFDKLERI
ncbi:hypothetical protein GZH53_02595 [Flavihumibacter sp. R14]|nr:hypothetical protein [Flavihumibacter soli]